LPNLLLLRNRYYQQLVHEFASLSSVLKPLLSELERCVAVFSNEGLAG